MNRFPALDVTTLPEPDGSVRLALAGELDIGSAPRLAEAMNEHRQAKQAVVLDLARLTFMDSTGLGLLLRASQDAARDGWDLTLSRELPQPVARLFDLTGAQDVLPFAG